MTQSKKTHLLNKLKLKEKIDEYINSLFDNKIEKIKEDTYFLTNLLEEKEKEIESLKKDVNDIKKVNKQLSGDLTVLIHAINNLFYLLPIDKSFTNYKKNSEDEDDTYH